MTMTMRAAPKPGTGTMVMAMAGGAPGRCDRPLPFGSDRSPPPHPATPGASRPEGIGQGRIIEGFAYGPNPARIRPEGFGAFRETVGSRQADR